MTQTYRKIVAHTLSTDFAAATSIVTAALPSTLRPGEVLVRNAFVGVNASDVNYTAGVYAPDVRPPFDCGFEALGRVVAVGAAVRDVAVGDAVVTQSHGAFAEYQRVPRRHVKRAPSLDRAWLPLDLSATTASIALEQVLRPERGARAVVTAAAGGTGQFATQLLKRVYGCHVIGTCSTAAKARVLREQLGCDGVVDTSALADTSADGVAAALRAHYPQGVQLAYESVGGTLLDAVVDALALRARVLCIGAVSSYVAGGDGGDAKARARRPLQLRLLSRSASLHTFFLPHYVKHAERHFAQLCAMRERGELHSLVDDSDFRGLEGVYAAVAHLLAGRNCGKVIVAL